MKILHTNQYERNEARQKKIWKETDCLLLIQSMMYVYRILCLDRIDNTNFNTFNEHFLRH